MTDLISIDAVKSRLLTVRGQATLLDRDVAALYGVETREVNQAVRNNPDKFPQGYVVDLVPEEVAVLRSKFAYTAADGKTYQVEMSYSKNLFWDADVQTLDYDVNKRYVIERVLNRGTLDDIRTAFGYYGKDVIAEVATTLRTLEPKALSFASCLLSIPREHFRCYIGKQSSKAPWIY